MVQALARDADLGMVSVTDVSVSPDLKNAQVYVTQLAASRDPGGLLAALDAAASRFRHRLGRELRLRYVPRLRFQFDDSLERGDRSVIATFPGESLDNAYSMNVADVCPVGALTTRDFRFRVRVWFLEDVPSDETCCEYDPPAPPGEILGFFSGVSLADRSIEDPWTTLPSAWSER